MQRDVSIFDGSKGAAMYPFQNFVNQQTSEMSYQMMHSEGRPFFMNNEIMDASAF